MNDETQDAVSLAKRRLARAVFIEAHQKQLLSYPNVCIGSGGVMGHLLVGAIEGLFSHVASSEFRAAYGSWIRGLRGFSGVSVGSLVASCLACRVDLRAFKNIASAIPVAEIIKRDVTRDLAGVVRGDVSGMFEGDSLVYIASTLLMYACGNGSITFRELSERFGSDLRVLTVRVHDSFEVVFSSGNTPHIPVAAAVAASMSIPGVFAPALIEGVLYMDGGVRNQTGAGMFPTSETLHITPRARGEYIENPRAGLSVLRSLTRVLTANYAAQISSQFSSNADCVILVDSETKSEISTVAGSLFSLDSRKIDEMQQHGRADVGHRTLCFWILIFAATCRLSLRKNTGERNIT
jgi:hypothetical protein